MFKSDDYKYLKEYFPDPCIGDRYIYLEKRMQNFIESTSFKDDVIINQHQFEQMILNYFSDIQRIKPFHNIDLTNSVKRTSYLAFWLLRNKPMQVITQNINCSFINELFVVNLITFECCDNECWFVKENDIFTSFAIDLFYYIRYRHFNAQQFELAIQSFKYGLKLFSDSQSHCLNPTVRAM